MSIYVRDIRRAVAELIRQLELPGVAPEHVYTNRTRPYDVERMPAVCVFSLSETSEIAEDAPRVNACECEIAIAVYVRTVAREDTDEDDRLDDYLQVIREMLMANDTINCQAEGSRYNGCEWILSNEGEFAMGAAVLRYGVRYRETMPEAVGGHLDNLLHINTKWDGAPKPDGTKDAEDNVHY